MRRMVFLLLLALAAAGCPSAPKEGTAPPTPTGDTTAAAKPMPSFSLNRIDGAAFASAEISGKPTMVNFWHPE
jgi:hypothetical protein